jgi:hypothetical protein
LNSVYSESVRYACFPKFNVLFGTILQTDAPLETTTKTLAVDSPVCPTMGIDMWSTRNTEALQMQAKISFKRG